MARKRKHGGVGAKGSGGIRFFHPSAPLREKYGDACFNRDRLTNLTITGECRRVFSRRSREASGYECTHPDFPGTTFQVAKNNFLVTEEGEAPFESEIVQQVPPPPPPAQEEAVAAATTTEENISINQALRESVGNSNPSITNNIFATVRNSGRNLAGADASELRALGLEVENEDPLPENLQNVGTMNCAAEAVGNWITPIICPRVKENCRNTNGKFSLMSWEIVAEADELELFKVRFD